MNEYFLTRNREFILCETVKQDNYRRFVKMLEGVDTGKTIIISPENVATGRLFPRVFKCKEKPTEFYEYKGRILLKPLTKNELVPEADPGYKMQPWIKDVIDSVNRKENILLTGGTGVGKTTHIVELAAAANQPLLRVNFNGETRISDFLGKMSVVNGNTKWVDGILPTAMRNGYWLLLDEYDMGDPAILALLNPVLEHENPVLVLKENNGEVIRPHKDFRVFATANSIGAMEERAGAYAGTSQGNMATQNRWPSVLYIQNLSRKEELKVIRLKVNGMRLRWAKAMVEFAAKVREGKVDGGIEFNPETFGTRQVLAWANKTARYGSPIVGAELTWLNTMPESEHEAVRRVLKLHFGALKRPREKKEEVKKV